MEMTFEFTNDEVLEIIDSVNDRIENLYGVVEESDQSVYLESIEILKSVANKFGEHMWDEEE